jgi:hypothetical protein
VTIRTTKKTVTFTRPFTIKGVDEVLPAGVYSVETDEEPVENISFVAYRRISTLLHVPGKPGDRVLTRMLTIDPKELDAALERDQTRAVVPVGQNAHQEALAEAKNLRWKVADRQAIERGENEGMMVHSG